MTEADSGCWSEIRRSYTQTNEPVSAICDRFGISAGSLYSRARRESWPKRRQTRDAAKPAGLAGPAQRHELVARLYETLRQQMTAIEKRLQLMPDLDDTNATATAERDARTLSTLVRTLEKLIELQGDAIKGPGKVEDASAESDADKFRIELVRRIEGFKG